ncbi:SDR family NAD(P)-dependent oxidoreductase [Janibacter anophelis]|uniref:SDR family NAD(P)-dependent oxidoreductase n=1 Tax=Janibacter anophelis TaxID=319054 RepID=UPI003F80255A
MTTTHDEGGSVSPLRGADEVRGTQAVAPQGNAFDMTGRVAVVVGASAGGLGQEAARALAAAGATVAVANLPGLAEQVEAVRAALPGTGHTTHVVDVTDEASVRALADEVVAAHGRVDSVVNAAGVMLRKAYDETSVEEFERIIRVNLVGCWIVGREFGSRLAAAGGGQLVNLTTVYAERVGPIPESAYYASKAGVVGVTRSLASELGRDGVSVNAIAPAVFYPTAMTMPLGDDPDQLRWFAERTMLGRLGDVDRDFAGPLLLLATPASSYVTGQVLYVDGGWSAW